MNKELLLSILFPQKRDYNDINLYRDEIIIYLRKLSDEQLLYLLDQICNIAFYINNKGQYCILIGNRSKISEQFDKLLENDEIGPNILSIIPKSELWDRIKDINNKKYLTAAERIIVRNLFANNSGSLSWKKINFLPEEQKNLLSKLN